MCATLDKAANVATAQRLVEQAVDQGANLVVLPELFNGYGSLAEVVQAAEPIPGPTSEFCARLAEKLGIFLCAGSICEQSTTPGKGWNTSLVFGPDGNLVAKYRKIHLFDVAIPGGPNVTESKFMDAGAESVTTRFGAWNLGHATCYDLRFPELFRALATQNVEVLIVPAAFTSVTGRDHWEVLVRARAIENQAFVLAANQFGTHAAGVSSYGHSLVVDPWGDVLGRASGDREEVLIARLESTRLQSVRAKVPALTHRRFS